MAQNRATIYSNGIADFQRVFKIESGDAKTISIPVRQQHLGDVLASLTVAGAVKIDSPPSFQPANQDETNIRIDTGNAIVSLAHQLSGSNVSITTSKDSKRNGQLIGMHAQPIGTEGHPIQETFLVLLTDSGIQRISVNKIESLEFNDPIIQAEINKALSRSLRQIKPNSTFVDLKLSTEESSTDAIVQYTIPAAAWKISYRLILADEGPIRFHGHAIVDNNTDEDWKDFVIAVVMGQPITFSTDVADSKMPNRNHVNVVQETAFGAVEVEEAMDAVLMDALHDESAPAAPEARKRLSKKAMRSGRGGDFVAGAMMKQAASSMERELPEAAMAEAEITETGDFCIFESSEPVSIDARRSAVIPVFQSDLDKSAAVLHYRESNHTERPFQSIRFKNTTEHSLGRGVCTVYDESTYAGTCILPSTKPDADALLPHALETSVRVMKKVKPLKHRRVGIRVSEGVGYESHHQSARTEYLINGTRKKPMPFILDHDWQLHNAEIKITLQRNREDSIELTSKELKRASRIEFDLKPNDTLAITVMETKVSKSKINLIGKSREANYRIDWLFNNIVETNGPLADDPGVLNCMELKRQLDEKEAEIQHAGQEISRLAARQERARKNIKSGGSEKQTARFQDDLAKSEDAILELEEVVQPKLKTKREKIRDQLYDALKTLAIEWAE